jgi:hypothetical protein
MRRSKRPSSGMAGSRRSRRSWGGIRQPFGRGSALWKRQRRPRRGASAKRGWPPAAPRRTADPRSASPPLLAGGHRWGSEAGRRPVDALVVTRLVATAVGARPACESPHDPTPTEPTHTRPTPSAQAKDDGPPSRPSRPMRKPRPPAAGVCGARRCRACARHAKAGMTGQCTPRWHALHRRDCGNLCARFRLRKPGAAAAPRKL